MQVDFNAIKTAVENIAAWVVLVAACAGALGGFWALVDTCINSGGRLIRKPSPPADLARRRAELHFATHVVPSRKELL